jgi:DNA invertase Pin-like site-specific DNA recombinase
MPSTETGQNANPAAAYVRMSTEQQQYSTQNQLDVIQEYAKRRGLTIVKVYSDEPHGRTRVHQTVAGKR